MAHAFVAKWALRQAASAIGQEVISEGLGVPTPTEYVVQRAWEFVQDDEQRRRAQEAPGLRDQLALDLLAAVGEDTVRRKVQVAQIR